MASQVKFHLPFFVIVYSNFIHLMLVTAAEQHKQKMKIVMVSHLSENLATSQNFPRHAYQFLSRILGAEQQLKPALAAYDVAIWRMDNQGFPGFDKRNSEDVRWAVNVCNYAAGFCAENGVQLYVQGNKQLFNLTGAVFEILSVLVDR
ncbi:hypothetical protein WN943_007858 [Citrus x changshan-huyou]